MVPMRFWVLQPIAHNTVVDRILPSLVSRVATNAFVVTNCIPIRHQEGVTHPATTTMCIIVEVILLSKYTQSRVLLRLHQQAEQQVHRLVHRSAHQCPR